VYDAASVVGGCREGVDVDVVGPEELSDVGKDAGTIVDDDGDLFEHVRRLVRAFARGNRP
jgi:hypothetical protein